jgi:hypothetical protein
LSKALPTQAPATPPNDKKVLLFLLLQLFWAYCNTFRVLKQGQNLVVPPFTKEVYVHFPNIFNAQDSPFLLLQIFIVLTMRNFFLGTPSLTKEGVSLFVQLLNNTQ